MTINEIQDEIIEEFSMFDDWMERYQLITEYANDLKKHPMPAADKTDVNKIDGCQSTVWFTAKLENGKIIFNGDADALLVKGVVALLIRVLSNHTPKEILDANLYFIDDIQLREHLSPTRNNGIVAMLKQLKLYALAYANS